MKKTDQLFAEILAGNYFYYDLTEYTDYAIKKCLEYFPDADILSINASRQLANEFRDFTSEIENFNICIKLYLKNKRKQKQQDKR